MPALTKAGKGVLVWKTIWLFRQSKQPLIKIIKNNIEITGLSEKEVPKLTLKQIRIELRRAVMTLKEMQREARRMRGLWLEEMAMKNDIESGEQDAQKVLKTMLRKMSTKAMNDKLNRITHGERGGLDYIEVPRGE